MERRELCLSKIAGILILLSCVWSCRKAAEPKPIVIPVTYRAVSDPDLGRKQDTLYYKADKYNGYVYQLSDAGDTLLLFGYWEGLKEGVLRKWYPNKQLQEMRYYHEGKKNGVHTGWWENGNKKFEFRIVDDLNEGNFKEWNHDGRLIKDFNYVHGHEQGSEKLWWNDGTIRANYVVDNGRKYGLIGLKICRNVYDSTK